MGDNHLVSETGGMNSFVDAELAEILFCGSTKEKQALELVSLSHSRHESVRKQKQLSPLTGSSFPASFLAARPGLSGKALLVFEVGRC